MKAVLQNIGLVILSVAFAFSVAEVGLRVTGFGPGNPFDRLLNHNDLEVGYRMVPGAHETIGGPDGVYDVRIISLEADDERGFRDDGRQGPVHSVFFGDSFVWGYGVSIADSISEQFEKLTGEDVVNLGMTAFTSPTQYARLFEIYGPVIQPKYAFFGIFIGNDFGDSLKFDEWSHTDREISYPAWCTQQERGLKTESKWLRARLFVYRRSALWRFISDRIDFGFSGVRVRRSELVEVNTHKLDLVLDPGEIKSEMGNNAGRQVELVKQALKRISVTASSIGTQAVAFIIPTKELVYQSYQDSGPGWVSKDVRYPILLKLLEESEIDYIDLLPFFSEVVEHDGEQLYFRVDGHWNPAGHALAASVLYDHVAGQPVWQADELAIKSRGSVR